MKRHNHWVARAKVKYNVVNNQQINTKGIFFQQNTCGRCWIQQLKQKNEHFDMVHTIPSQAARDHSNAACTDSAILCRYVFTLGWRIPWLALIKIHR